jgi:hypothetical protein
MMTSREKKLLPAEQVIEQDLRVLEAMSVEMGNYLESDALFYPLMHSDLPQLTLGGYLMREHRLVGLSHKMEELYRERLAAAMDRFREAVVGHVVRVEQRATDEIEARQRQWREALRDMSEESYTYEAYYATAVEIRAMLEALMDYLQQPPYQLAPKLLDELNRLDQRLREQWQEGPFVWHDVWQAVYPPERYWWLYGRPRKGEVDSG